MAAMRQSSTHPVRRVRFRWHGDGDVGLAQYCLQSARTMNVDREASCRGTREMCA